MNFGFLSGKLFPSYLGVDIGTTSIKAIEVKKGKQLPLISNYGILELSSHLVRANKVLQTSSLKIFEDEAADLLKTLIAKMGVKTDRVIASLPSFAVFMTVLDFPDMKEEDLVKAMTFQARQYIPLPISEVAIDYLKIGEYGDEKGFKHQQVLLISVPREQINKYQQLFKKVGLHLAALEIESLSLVRMLVGSDPTPTLILDIGSHSTGISFVVDGQLRFSAQSDYASATLTQALASSLNINPLRAEELKKERGILSSGPNFELSTIMMPFLDVIINEVKKAQFNYQSQFPGSKGVERVILSGGGANLLGMERYVQEQLQLPTVKAAPFLKFEYSSAIEPLVPELNPRFSVSLGLVLRQFT
jgi:type IV pilus assembly protein PilM